MSSPVLSFIIPAAPLRVPPSLYNKRLIFFFVSAKYLDPLLHTPYLTFSLLPVANNVLGQYYQNFNITYIFKLLYRTDSSTVSSSLSNI